MQAARKTAYDGHTYCEIAMSESKELHNMGLKATLPRLKVLDIFQSSEQRHMSAEDVYKLLLNENAEITRPRPVPSSPC